MIFYSSPQRRGAGPGYSFSEGKTDVQYYARDRAGNRNDCVVVIVVKGNRFI